MTKHSRTEVRAGMYSGGLLVCCLITALLAHSCCGMELYFDHDLDYYPESHHSFELDFLDAESHSHMPDHDSGHVKDAWQQHLGDEVRGGYTVQDLDGTVTHFTYSQSRPQNEDYF